MCAAPASDPPALVLAGDVGATKTNLGLFRAGPQGPQLVRADHVTSADFPGLGALIESFLSGARGDEAGGVGAACFGVAGPVVDNHTRTPNLAWEIDGGQLSAESGIPRFRLANDLVATAAAIPLLGEEDLALLHPGAPGARGNLALIAAGTGLGMALAALVPEVGEEHAPVASEGGHMDWAPRTDEETALHATLRDRFGHVSAERVVSGSGLVNIYEHLRDRGAELPDEAVERELHAGEDAARAISAAGLAGRSPICVRALDLFAAAYGAAAGNLALVGTATGGVYLGGGIAPKLLPKLADGTFLRAFLDKGRLRSYLEAIPVRVILNEKAAMYGAARLAARLAGPA